MFKLPSYSTFLLSELQCQRKKPSSHAKTYCNIELILSNKKSIYAHKSVLAAQSRYFDKLINDHSECKFLELELDLLLPEIAEAMIDLCYTGEIDCGKLDRIKLKDGLKLFDFKCLQISDIEEFYDSLDHKNKFLDIKPKVSLQSKLEILQNLKNLQKDDQLLKRLQGIVNINNTIDSSLIAKLTNQISSNKPKNDIITISSSPDMSPSKNNPNLADLPVLSPSSSSPSNPLKRPFHTQISPILEEQILNKLGITLNHLQERVKDQDYINTSILSTTEKQEFAKIRRRERSKATARTYRKNKKERLRQEGTELNKLKEENKSKIKNLEELVGILQEKNRTIASGGDEATTEIKAENTYVLAEASGFLERLKEDQKRLEEEEENFQNSCSYDGEDGRYYDDEANINNNENDDHDEDEEDDDVDDVGDDESITSPKVPKVSDEIET